jgi:hypothetical protein
MVATFLLAGSRGVVRAQTTLVLSTPGTQVTDTVMIQQIYNTADANGVMPSDHQPVLAVFEVR